MIVYKIDKESNNRINNQLQELSATIENIPAVLQKLQELLTQQGTTLNAPSIDGFRRNLQRKISEAITQTNAIHEESQKLLTVNIQASKHLTAIEEHFGSTLRDANGDISGNREHANHNHAQVQ